MMESSTVIEPREHNADPAQSAHKEQDAPAPKELAAGAKESRIDTIKRAAADIEKETAAKEPAAAAKEETPKETETKTQPVKAEADAAPEAPKSPKPSEGRKIIEAPARFLPRAKELWQNVPHPVREEFERVMKESESEVTRYREAQTFRDELKDYEEMARSNNTTIKQSLDNYVAIERKFAEDPAQGFRQLMSNLGMQPPQAISHILRAYGVTPQQLAAHMQQSPNEYTALAQPRQQAQMQPQMQPQQQQNDPRVQQLEQRLQSMEVERVHNSIIAPFAQEYPEYYQFEGQIAEVLKSGIIDKIHGAGLSPRDKLEAALLMVAPQTQRSYQGNPANTVQAQTPLNDTPAVDLRGTKSIKGAPGSGTDSSGRRGKSMSRTEAIAAAAAELGVRL